jgi:hypothetical protein
MACFARNYNHSAVLDAEVESLITDAAASSLSATTAAMVALRRLNGVTHEQIFAAAIHVIRETAVPYREAIDDLEGEISSLEDDVSDCEIEIEDLRAELKKANAPPAASEAEPAQPREAGHG